MLGLVSLLTDAATEMIYPLIPVYVALLGSGPMILGIIEGVAETTAALLKLITGILSDRIHNRKIFILTGYTISSLFRPITGLVFDAWQIVPVRLVDRIGKGIRSAPRDALIAASVDESIRGKAFGFHRAMDHLGAVVGPILALLSLYILFEYYAEESPEHALRITFLLALIPGLLSIATILFFVREDGQLSVDTQAEQSLPPMPMPLQAPLSVIRSIKNLDGNFKRYLMVIVLFTLGNSSDAFLLFRVEEALNQSGAMIHLMAHFQFIRLLVESFADLETRKNVINLLMLPVFWGFFHLIKSSFSVPLGSLSDRLGRKAVINLGWAVYALVYFAFAALDRLPQSLQIWAIFSLFAVYALYYAFTEGAEKALVADLVSEQQRGSAYGLYNFAIGMTALPASIIFGLLYDRFGGDVAFVVGGLLAICAMALFFLAVREHPAVKY